MKFWETNKYKSMDIMDDPNKVFKVRVKTCKLLVIHWNEGPCTAITFGIIASDWVMLITL